MWFSPCRTLYYVEGLVKADRLRYRTHVEPPAIFAKVTICVIFKAFSVKQRAFLEIDFEIFPEYS